MSLETAAAEIASLAPVLAEDSLLNRETVIRNILAEAWPRELCEHKTCPTYTATIYCGLMEGYSGPTTSPLSVQKVCQEYVDQAGLAVTVAPTQFIYTKGHEAGLAIGLINYPRFPSTPEKIREHAIAIAKRVMLLAKQQRVTIVCSDTTIMLEN